MLSLISSRLFPSSFHFEKYLQKQIKNKQNFQIIIFNKMFAITFQFVAVSVVVAAAFLLDDAMAYGPRAFLKRQVMPSGSAVGLASAMRVPKAAASATAPADQQQSSTEQFQQQQHLFKQPKQHFFGPPYMMETARVVPFIPTSSAYYGGGIVPPSANEQQQEQLLQHKRFDYYPSTAADSSYYNGYEGFFPFVPAKRFDGGFGTSYGSRGRFSGFL